MKLDNPTRRIYLGSELVSSVDRFPSPIELDDDDDERTPTAPDLGSVARLARTAQRGVLDYISIDDTLAGNPPFSGRRRGGLDSVRLATRLATATEGICLIPTVRSNWVEPSSLLEALVTLEITSEGRHGWELQLHEHPSPQMHSGELLSAIVHDTWSHQEPLTKLAASARAMRRQGLSRRAGGSASTSAGGGSGPGPGARPGSGKGPGVPTGSRRPAKRDPTDAASNRPVTVIRADTAPAAALAAERADIARIAAVSMDDAAVKRDELLSGASRFGRTPDDIKVLVDLTVTLASEPAQAEARKDLAEGIIGQRLGGEHVRYVGTPAGLAERCVEWTEQGACDGFTFLPTSLPVDLMMVVDGVTPALAAASHFPSAYGRGTSHATVPRSIPVRRRASATPR
ncbi:MAG: LLM class flavin-dependent oxidoreductase [Bifidobacteriaceae bacterium]|nr:LLM class flavin-dependent oxidoreductase [Bifidobacteriaceae bacterium]